MDILAMIILALFAVSALETYWQLRSACARERGPRRLSPRRLPAYRQRLRPEAARAPWTGRMARASTVSGPRWWWE